MALEFGFSRKSALFLSVAVICLAFAPGCGDSGSSEAEEISSVREALLDLPYQVVLRDVETPPPGTRGVIKGSATDTGQGRTVEFAFILGNPEGKWLKKYVKNVENAAYNSEVDMQYAMVGPEGKTLFEEEEIVEMEGDIKESVCRALVGTPCPI